MGLKDDEDNDYIWMQQILNINPDDAFSDNLRKNSCFFFWSYHNIHVYLYSKMG